MADDNKIPTDEECAAVSALITSIANQAMTAKLSGRVGDLADAAFVLAAAYAAVLATAGTTGEGKDKLSSACLEGSSLGVKMVLKGALVLTTAVTMPSPTAVQ